MCPTKIEPKIEPLQLDLAPAFSLEQGFGRAALLELGPRLETIRQSLLAEIVAGLQPALAQPQSLLDEYKTHRRESILGRILSLAKGLRERVDRVVIVGPAALIGAAEALFRACCHPYHNDLERGQRGGRPRIYFVPAVPDNDAIQALLEILPCGRMIHGVDEKWGIVAIDSTAKQVCEGVVDLTKPTDGHPWAFDSNHGLITPLFKILWEALQSTSTVAEESELAAVVGPADSTLTMLAKQIGIPGVDVGRGHDETWFQAGVLLAASAMGMDTVQLLRGAALLHQRFAMAPPGNNPPLDFAGLCHLLAAQRNIHQRQIISSASALGDLAGKLQHFSGTPDLLVQWLAAEVRHDTLLVTMPLGKTADGRVKQGEQTLIEIATQQARAVQKCRAAVGQPTVVVRLPVVSEASVGQLLQMFLLAGAVESRLNAPARSAVAAL